MGKCSRAAFVLWKMMGLENVDRRGPHTIHLNFIVVLNLNFQQLLFRSD